MIPIGWMLAIFLGSDQNHLPGPEGIPSFDKVAHFGAFGLLGTLWVRALACGDVSWRAALVALVVVSAYGATDEFHQSFRPGRSVEFGDWVADTAGAALAVALYRLWPAYRRVMDHPVVRKPHAAAGPALDSALSDQHP